MILNLGTIQFNANIEGGGGTPSWGTELGQGEGYKFSFEDMDDFLTSMVYKSVPDIDEVYCPLGKGGSRQDDFEYVLASIYEKVFVNGLRVEDGIFLLLIVKQKSGDHHKGRRSLKYNPRMTYRGEELNSDCYNKIAKTLGLSEEAAWFIDEINVRNQDELHFTAYVLGEDTINFVSSQARKDAMLKHRRGTKTHITSRGKARAIQTILYGAPGTGKSYTLENRFATSESNTFRTTFHPDSDYSSFVGCYKPMQSSRDNEKITYQFVPQAFIKAYIRAWKLWVNANAEDLSVNLIIEEINRGNCAQIFGDIFQLLDRDDKGFSTYAIVTDEDIRTYLMRSFFDIVGDELFKQERFKNIATGEVMILPPNLNILATMNTSDQSLFPIDSAFKRRWDWEYIPIQYSPIDDVTKETIANKINIKGTTYDWGEFIKAVNERIYQLTKSEDKELGYFFVRPDDGIYITMQRFVSKVIFYLWSDIYKDYAGRENSIFKFSEDSNGKNKIDHSFNSFFNEKEINVKLVKMFIEQFVGTDNAADAKMKYKVNGGAPVGGRRIAVEAMKKYVEKFSQQTPQQVLEQWNTLGISVPHFVETEDVFQSRTDTPRSELITWGENNKIYVTTNGWVYNTNEQYKVSTIKQLVEAINSKEDWGIKVEIVEQ